MHTTVKSFSFKYLRNLSNRTDTESIKKSLNQTNSYKHWTNIPQFSEPLKFKNINLFIGENGSGKSTIIDSLRSLSNINILPSIPREIANDRVQPEFKVKFSDNSKIFIKFSMNSKENTLDPMTTKITLTEIDRKGQKSNPCLVSASNQDSIFNVYDCNRIKFWDGSDSLTNIPKNIKDVFRVMNENIEVFLAVSCDVEGMGDLYDSFKVECFNIDKNGMVNIYCSDDMNFLNKLEYRFLPHGWRLIISLISFLMSTSKGDIILIEEPEGHLHPRLQRFIVKFMSEYLGHRQAFITTHSATIINSFNSLDNVQIFHTKGHIIEAIPKLTRDVLQDLDTKASDILQINGIIWVEGPSDRIYLTAWLNYHAKINKLPPIDIGEDCEFLYYGGALLSHIGEGDKKLISAVSVNKNGIFVMDKDLNGDVEKFPKTTKAKINKIYNNSEQFYSWVTCYYTIESYLPKKYLKKYFKYDEGRLKAITNTPKVKIAKTFSMDKLLIKQSYEKNPGLREQLEVMYSLIKKWN